MEEVLSFLRKFNRGVNIILEPQKISSIDQQIPVYWKEAFNCRSKDDRLMVILNEWDKYHQQMSKVSLFLKRNLKDVLLIESKGIYSLLYIMANSEEEVLYYEGRVPSGGMMNNTEINELWNAVPSDIKVIYEKLHDGWVYYPSQSNGLSPIANLDVLGESEWGVLEELENADALQEKLDHSIGFFHNGGGSYLAVDIRDKDKDAGFIWFKDRAPKLDIHFWDMYNAWFFASIDEDYEIYVGQD